MSSNQFFTLANWDGSLSSKPASSSSSAEQRPTHPAQHTPQDTPANQKTIDEQQLKQTQSEVVSMPPPPLPQTPMRGSSQWASQTAKYENGRRNSCSAMSISSESSFSNNEEDRRRVEGMLLASDDPTALSPAQLEHHWKIPVDVLSDTVDTVNAWAPRLYAPPLNPVQWPHPVQSPLFEERQQFPRMAPFVSISPPVSVSARPIDKKSASPSMKGGNNEQEGLASSNDSTPPHSQIPPSLSFSPSHYRISELPSVLDEDIIVSPQPKPRESPSIGVSEHKPLSSNSNPASDPVEPATPISLSASFGDDDFHMSAQSLSPEIPMIIPTSKNHGNIELQASMELHSLEATFQLSDNLGGLDTVETSAFGLDRQSSSVEPGSACAVEPMEASQQTFNSEPPLSVISSSLGSLDDTQLRGMRNSKTPVPSVKLVGTSFPASLRDVSVVPETPLADSPTSSDGFRLLHARTREPATPRSDSPMRVSESCSPGGLSGAQPFVSRSTGESTLVDPSQQVMHKAGQPMMDYVQTVDNDANLDSSPLSSPPSPTIPLPPRATVYVDVPPLPAHRKREQARPISTYFVDMPPPLPIKGSNLIKGQHTGAHKRKRTTEVSRSPTTTRSPRAKKPRAHDKLNSPISPLCEIGLESLGHDAHDALKPFCEYVETDIDFDLDTIIEDRFPDPFLLDKLLQPMFRHLYALFSGVEKKAPVPGPARSSKPLIELPRPISRRSPPPLPPLLVRPPISPLKANQNLEYPNIAQTPSKRPFAVNEIHNLDIPSAQLTFPSQQQHLQAIALVRDRDAFLGVQEDPDDDDVVFKSSPMALGGDSSELYGSVEEPSLEPLNLHVENQGSSFSSAPYRSSNFGHEGAVFYSEDGTINPMLLAPPPLPNAVNQFRTPSPSLVPSSPEIPLRYSLSQSTSVVDNEVSSFYESSVSSDDEYDPGLRKSKGKERASDVGILARQTVTEPELPPLWTSVGKRDRRPTAKAMEAMQSVGEDGTRELSMSLFSDAALPSKGPVKARRKGKVERKVGENFEYGFCHQCRGNNGYAKMQCRGMRENGEPCLLLFCEKCVLKRYSTSQLTFDLGATDFVCPKCEGFCNCTTCCKKRGEVYVSTKHVKTGLEIRTQKRARLRQKNDDFDDDYNYRDDERYTEDGGDDDIHITIPGALPVGEQFGAVYDLTGRRRIGVGIVADGPSQQIVLVSTTATTVRRDAQPTIKKKPLKTPRKRQFIGQPKSTWRVVDDADAGDPPVGRAYIGKRGPLFNGAAYKSFDAIMCFEGPLTPDFDEGEDASVNLEDSPSKTLDSALLSFALANLLGGGVSSPVDGDDGGGTSVLEREREPV